MFDYIKIEGYRSLKSIELNLSPLSVLIGPNGGGKSNLIDLLALLTDAGKGQLANGVLGRGGFSTIAFGFDPHQEIRLEVLFNAAVGAPRVEAKNGDEPPDLRFKLALRDFGGGPKVVEELVSEERRGQPGSVHDIVERRTSGAVFRVPGESGLLTDQRREVTPSELVISQIRDPSRYPAPSVILEELASWAFYFDIGVGPQSPVRQPAVIRPGIQLFGDGSNLSSVLYAIQQEYPNHWEEISDVFKTANANFQGLTVPARGGDGKVILRWSETPFDRHGGQSANLLSDGTLKLLCLVTILMSPEPPSLICIDEPELGLHPDWIKLVAELLQTAADRTQVIVATHSPQIVAKLDPEQVIVTDKQDGETTLRRLDKHELQKWLDEFSLSDLWLAGHFGGRP